MDGHTKYSRDVIPGIEDSLSKIAAKITANSLVLDVGCSTGMMGRYLASEKNCIVDGVDIDEKALENCKTAYRKIAIKNLETDDLTDVLVEESYDFIIVADVIEHLNDPGQLLAQLKLLVKPYGTIIFSVPNITHIAASLELLLGNFDYRQHGLLDSTHVRFYSYTNLVAKFINSGLYIWEVDVVHKELGETEFGVEQIRLFPQKWLDTLIDVRPDSLVYQWIIATKIHPRPDQIESHPATKKVTAKPVFTTGLYWKDSAGAKFDEIHKTVGIKTSEIENELAIDFDFQLLPEETIYQIRIDPVSEKKLVWIKSAQISNAQNVVLWKWPGKEWPGDLVSAKWVDTQINNGKILSAESDDPQWYPEIPIETLQKIDSGAKFSIVMCVNNSAIGSVLVDALTSQQVATIQAGRDERDSRRSKYFYNGLAHSSDEFVQPQEYTEDYIKCETFIASVCPDIGGIDRIDIIQSSPPQLQIIGWAASKSELAAIGILLGNTPAMRVAAIPINSPSPVVGSYAQGRLFRFQAGITIGDIPPSTTQINIVGIRPDTVEFLIMSASFQPPAVLGNLDLKKFESGDLVIEGWAISASGPPLIRALNKNGKEIALADTGISRPDVAKAWPAWPDAASSGFKLRIPSDIASNGEIRVLADNRRGEILDLSAKRLR